MNNIEKIKGLALEITKDFEKYMDSESEYNYWISNDVFGTFEMNDTYWDLWNMVEVLENKYDPKKVFDWHEYNTFFSWENREYALNLKNFIKLYTWDFKEFVETYRKNLDNNRKLCK